MKETERKFLIKKMPDISSLQPLHYERFILPTEEGEERIQKVGDLFELEKLVEDSDLTRHIHKKSITKDEFERLKRKSLASVERDSYQISKDPNITVNVYKGIHKGLARAEVGFESEDEAHDFVPLEWMGKEITNSPLGRDSKLAKLSKDEFTNLIKEI